MKSKQFEYAVYSAGRMIAGGFTVKRAIGIERATQEASWKAQERAHKDGWDFDLMNFSVAVQPVINA
jgi:hypothetical protein